MTAVFYLLLVIGHLGVFDVLYFHTYRCQLDRRAECQREVLWHTLRHIIYATQFIVIANFRFHGAALLILAMVYAADVFIAWADVLEETNSRRPQGGLPRGEYFMHIVLSLLVGCYFLLVLQTVWPDRNLPAAIVIDPPPVPALLRAYMTLMGVGAIGAFFVDAYRWVTFERRTALHLAQSKGAQASS
jgi:hypothetical protein